MILLIEDHSETLYGLAHRLSRRGHSCVSTTTGEEALELLQTLRPRIIVLDWRLPGMSGMQTLQKIREIAAHENTAVITYSAYMSREENRDAQAAGATQCLNKGETSELELEQIIDQYDQPSR